MSHSSRITASEMLKVMRLLAEVTAHRHQPALQQQMLVDGLHTIVGTNQGFFFFTAGWQRGLKPRFTHQALSAQNDPVFLQYMADFGIHLPLEADPYCTHSINDQSDLQVWSHNRVVPDRSGEKKYDAFMSIVRGGRVSDGVVCLHRLPGNRTVGVGLHQFGRSKQLTARQRELTRFAVEEIHRLVQLGYIPQPKPQDGLSPRLQQVLNFLLVGDAPKNISRKLGIAIWTTREYIQKIYDFYGVSGRDELMAKWIQ